MKRSAQIEVLLGIALAMSFASAPASFAQRGGARVPPPPRAAAPRAETKAPAGDGKTEKQQDNATPGSEKPAENSAGAGSGRNMMGLPSTWVERLQDMTPAEQEKFLSNNDRFKNMTPQQQAQIRARLQYWNNLSPSQRQELREREQLFERMTPEQRQYVRETLLPKWQAMPPASKIIIRRHLARLSGLSDSERDAMLNKRGFMKNMTPEEQNMLRELNRLRVGDTPDAPPAPNGE